MNHAGSSSERSLPAELDDVGFNEDIAPNGRSTSTSQALRRILPLEHRRLSLVATEPTTINRTAKNQMTLSGFASVGFITRGASISAETGRLQSVLPTAASGSSYGSFKYYPNTTTAQLLLVSTVRPSANINSMVSASAMVMRSTPRWYPTELLPRYHKTMGESDNSSGGMTKATSILTEKESATLPATIEPTMFYDRPQ